MEFKVINKFKNGEYPQRDLFIEKFVEIICKNESNENVKYIPKIKK